MFKMTIPNGLTLLRIALIPIFIVLFYLPFSWSNLASAIVFAIAAMTDWLDGYLARKLGQSSNFGAFLDPVADKLMVVVALVLLVEQNATIWVSIPALVIIGREVLISALREWMAEMGQRASVAVSQIGKVKTTLQLFSIIALLAFPATSAIPQLFWLGIAALYLAVVLTLWSMLVYLKAAWLQLSN